MNINCNSCTNKKEVNYNGRLMTCNHSNLNTAEKNIVITVDRKENPSWCPKMKNNSQY